jgi:hypothetical protein
MKATIGDSRGSLPVVTVEVEKLRPRRHKSASAATFPSGIRRHYRIVANFTIGRVGSAIANGRGDGACGRTLRLDSTPRCYDACEDNLVRLTLLLIAVLFQFGCATRICQTKSLKMQWVDGTASTMEIVVCRPLFAWR